MAPCSPRRREESGAQAIDELDSEVRLNKLGHDDVLERSAQDSFDRINRLVCRLFGVEMAVIAFLDGRRQWFKSRQGLSAVETSAEISFCRHTVAEGEPLVVENVLDDARFRDDPLLRGDLHLRFYAGAPIRSAQGALIGALCALDVEPRSFSANDVDLLSDLGRLVESELKLRGLGAAEGLTPALTREAFTREAERAIALAVRHRYDLTCIIFDIDHFRAFNDANGFATGDAALLRTAQTCQNLLRQSDIFGRIGGEEFAVALPHASPFFGLRVAEKLRGAIERQVIRRQDRVMQVTATFGVSSLGSLRLNACALLERADEAMHQAKRKGGNCCTLWQGADAEQASLPRRVLKAGKIVFNSGNSVIDCTVRRLSEQGARLDVASSDGVPRKFKLNIEADGFSRACTVAEKNEKRVEIVFE